jgi:hypothetical protein
MAPTGRASGRRRQLFQSAFDNGTTGTGGDGHPLSDIPICSADSAPSVFPEPVNHPPFPHSFGGIPGLRGTSGMEDLIRNYRGNEHDQG